MIDTFITSDRSILEPQPTYSEYLSTLWKRHKSVSRTNNALSKKDIHSCDVLTQNDLTSMMKVPMMLKNSESKDSYNYIFYQNSLLKMLI